MSSIIGSIRKGSIDQSTTLEIVDSTTFLPETGVAWNASGIDLWYRREGAAKVSITEATLASLTTAHSDGGFLEIADGDYRLDLPDAAVAGGADHVVIGGTVTGMIVRGGIIQLTDIIPHVEINLTSTAGTAANLRVRCVDIHGAMVDLSDFTTATSSVTLTPVVSGSALFTQAFVIGDINNNAFEIQKTTPGFTDDVQYAVTGSVTLDGVAYNLPGESVVVFG
jgi:hypothetical protein